MTSEWANKYRENLVTSLDWSERLWLLLVVLGIFSMNWRPWLFVQECRENGSVEKVSTVVFKRNST